ncbi:hypothetical protein Tco_0847238, partial [Tanacetum coccineum]
MGRDTITLEQEVSIIFQEYLQLFCSDYFIPESLHPDLPGPEDAIVNFPEGKISVYLMDLFGLIKNPNPKVKVGIRPRATHEVPLLQATASRVVNMEETPTISTSTGTPSAMEKSPLDFADKDVQTDDVGEHQTDNPVSTIVPQQEQPAAESAATEAPPETNLEQEVLTMGPPVNKRRRKRDRGETGANAPSKPDVAQSSKTTTIEDEDTKKSSSFTSVGRPPDHIYQPSWGITNSCRLDNPLVYQELVDHIIPPGCFLEMRHLPSKAFLSQYNINLARQVALGSQLRLWFEQESKLLKKSVAKIGRREQKMQVQDDKIKNLESLIETESDMKRAAEAKNETLMKELEDLRAHFSKLQLDSEQLTQQVATLQAQVTEMDARLDALSSDFDEELYPHMLTAIAGHRWMIGHGLRLAVMKCAESMELRQAFVDVVTAIIAKGLSDGLKDGVEHGKAGLDLASLEGHDSEANEKFNAALQALKDLKYPLVDDLKQLKDAPIDCIMASLHLESDTGEDSSPEVRGLGPCTSQLKIPIYPEVRDLRNPWAVREEILLEDAIATNISQAEKNKKSRLVCRTHRVSFAHHARSDGVPVSVL